MLFPTFGLTAITAALASLSAVAGQLGSSCSAPLGAGNASPNDPYWLETIRHQGISAFHPNPSGYQVFRNVKDFGARGDGVTDDTAAINAALSAGGRCGYGCESQTTTPAIVYFPSGTYRVSTPIIMYYYTHMIGDAKRPPTILAAPNFAGMAMIDADPYDDQGNNWWVNQNNFFRSIRNLVFDTRETPSGATTTGLHWQVSQATSLINLVFHMTPGSNHQGIWQENGSGGYMGDLTFNGGRYAMWLGNQQFTVKNVVINDAITGIYMHWNWGWSFQKVAFNNCRTAAVEMHTGGTTLDTQTAASLAFIDVDVTNTPAFIRTTLSSESLAGGSLVLSNIKLTSVPVAVGTNGGQTLLDGGSRTIEAWAQGNHWQGETFNGFSRGNIPAPFKAPSLLAPDGKIFTRKHPQYEDYSLDQIVSVRSEGARGDGRTDDTAALRAIFAKYAGCKIIFFDAGHYIVSETLTIPAGTRLIGEAWSVIAAKGPAFQNVDQPTVAVRAGAPGSEGIMEISDVVFSSIGPAPGAVILEWNIKQTTQGSAGTWDSHVRLAGSAGTNLQVTECIEGTQKPECAAATLGLHIRDGASGYFEATWVWLADHELDIHGSTRITVFGGRGLLSESKGPVWLIGTGSEHFVLYQYNFDNAADHYMGIIQTESPYFQPSPPAPAPYTPSSLYKDPTNYPGGSAWGLVIKQSRNILVFGAGLYSFFSSYTQECLETWNCQTNMVSVDSASTNINILSLNTVAVVNQINNGVPQSRNRNAFSSTVTSWRP